MKIKLAKNSGNLSGYEARMRDRRFSGSMVGIADDLQSLRSLPQTNDDPAFPAHAPPHTPALNMLF